MPPIVGVDFDNTVVSYDRLMHAIALDFGWITAVVPQNKTIVRDLVRKLPEGEEKWRRIQAVAYGEAMDQAMLIDGVSEFFRACTQKGVTACIVSHKGEFATADEKKINLREAALRWMEQNRFFDADGMGLNRKNVFFESTRPEKTRRIGQIGCDWFIDDLEEVFREETFPRDVRKVLFAPHHRGCQIDGITVLQKWSDIREFILN